MRCLLVIVALLLWLDPAAAAPRASKAAKKHYELALKQYKAEAFGEAIREFQVTYDIEAQPILLYNIAQSYRKLGQAQEAVKFYEQYLNEDSSLDGKKKRQVEGYLIELKAQLATVSALRAAKEQEWLKEKERAQEERLAREQQEKKAREEQERLAQEQTEKERLVKGKAEEQKKTVDLSLKQEPAPAAAIVAQAAPRGEARSVYKRWWFWTIIGGVAVAGGATAAGLLLARPASDPFAGQNPDVRIPLH